MYRKLKRTWSHNDLNYIPRFMELFPELKKVDREELADRFHELKLDFYCEEITPVSFWLRITLPLAIILSIVMLVFIPVKFIFDGKWGYSLGEKNIVLNYLKSLKLVY